MKTVNQKELAAILGLSTRQVRNLEDAGMPHGSDGRAKAYPLPEAVHWWRDREVARVLESHDLTDWEKERTRLTAAKAEAAERDNRVKAKELIDRRDVAAMVRGPLVAVDRTLKTAPRTLARKWAKVLRVKEAQALELIETLVEDVRAELRALAERV